MQVLVTGFIQPQRVVQWPPKQYGPTKGGNGMDRGQRAPDIGANQTESRQLALVYAARCRKDRVTTDVPMGTFLIYDVHCIVLIDIGPTHSYVASFVSITWGFPLRVLLVRFLY